MNHFYSNLKLMLLTLFAFMGMSVWADTAKWTASEQGYDNAEEVATVQLNDAITAAFGKGTGSTTPKYYTAGTAVRAYSGNTIAISGATGVTITGVTFTFGASDGTNDITVRKGEYADGTWSGSDDNVVFTIGGTKGNRRIAAIEVTYTGGSAPAVAAPVITPATGTYFGDQTVTITCATEGAKIYYLKTVNFEEDSEMQKDYAEYASPLSIKYDNGVFGKTTDATISAYAVIPATEEAAEQRSETVEVTLTWGPVYTSIAELNAAADEAGKIGAKAALEANELLVTYVNGQYNYLTDGISGLLLYGSNTGLVKGQKVSGLIKGNAKSFNGLPEMDQLDLTALEVVSEDNEVAPIVVAASKLETERMKWVNMFVTVTMAVSRDGELNVAEGSAAESYNFASQGTEFVVRNQFKQAIETVADKMYDVTGFYAIFNDGGQIYNTEVTEYVDPIDIMGDVTEYYIQNPSFDLDADGSALTAEQKASNGPLNIVGWTMSGVGSQFNNTEIRQANSTSTTSAFGTSDPSDGNYSLFFRQGWNRDGVVNEITLETDAYELPEGQYMISVDYKQAYSYDKAGSKDTKIKLSLELDDLNFGEAETEAAPVGNATYFNDTEWKTLQATVDVDYGDIDLQGSVSPVLKITLYAAGDKRSDFFLDNVRILRVSEEDIARAELEKVLADANEILKEPAGSLFQPAQEDKDALQDATDTAQEFYDDDSATAEAIRNQVNVLTAAIDAYVYADIIEPDPDALYTIKLKDGGNYMSITNEGTKLSAEPVGLRFASTDSGYSIANADASYYAACTGSGNNNWSMAASTTAYDWYIEALPSGEYTIAKASKQSELIGVDNSAAGSSCYANKSVADVGDRAIWIIEEYEEPATILEGIAALKNFTLDEGVEEADVVLRLTNAKVTYVGLAEQNDFDWDTWEEITVQVDNVVMEDATAGNLFQKLGLNDYLKVGDTVNGDIALKIVGGIFGKEYQANDKTAASLDALVIENGEAQPLEVNDDNVLEYAENFEWIFASFTDVTVSVDAESGDTYLQIPVMDASYGVMDLLKFFPEGVELEDGDVVTVTGYIYNYLGFITAFQPLTIKAQSEFENPAEVFTATTVDRGSWMYDADNNRMHWGDIPVSGEIGDEFKFALVEKDGEKFLYSLGAGKFIQPQKYFAEGITTPVEVVDQGDGTVMMKSANSPYTINIGGSQFTWDTWTAKDNGNTLTINTVGEFDATEALAMLENGAIDSHKVFTVTTERGQWAASADGNRLATVATNPTATDADKQFAFYYDGSKLYIYSVGAKKFFKNDGSLFAAKGDPVDYRIVAPNGYDHCFFFTDNLYYFNMQTSGAYAINTYNTPDQGNKQQLEAVEGIDVYDEMKEVFNTILVDVEYQVVYDGEQVASATATNAVGKAPQLPAELDNELCTYTYDVETITEDTKVVVVTAEWAGPFEFSESFNEAKWYNMKIRPDKGDLWISTLNDEGEEAEPYYPTANKDLTAQESQWAFAGNPYNVVIYNRARSESWTLQPADVEEPTGSRYSVVLREGNYAWDIFGNGDGFVLREKRTDNNYVNQAGGDEGPLAFWNSASGRRDMGSTIIVAPIDDSIILEGIAALKAFTVPEDQDYADVILRLTDAKVTFTGTGEDYDDNWDIITIDKVVMEDATAGNLFLSLGLGDYVKEGDVVSGDIHMSVSSLWGMVMLESNDKTAADLEALTIEAGIAKPLAITDDNVLEYAENNDWIYVSFKDAEISIEAGDWGDDVYVYLPVMDNELGVMDVLGALPEDFEYEDGQTVDVSGYIATLYGITFFQPIAFGAQPLELAVDVDYYKGQNGLTYEVDFTEALEFLGIESIDEATIAGVDVTSGVEVENYVIFDGWRNADGDYEQWGDNAAVCVKFAEEAEKFAIYDMGNDNVPAVGETFVARFHLTFDGKTVVYDINVHFVAPPAKYLADYTEKGSFDVTIFAPEKGVAFDGQESEAFEEAAVSELIGEMWSEIYGKGVTDEVGETFATEYTAEPQPGFWFLEDGIADTEENGVFSVSLIPAEDWSTFTFQASTKEAIENNLTTTFYLVNEETKEYVAYNITLSAKPAVNLVGEFDGFIKQILSHPQTGKQGEASGEQKVTIAEGEEPGTYDITYSGFTMPVTGAILPEFTITGVEAETSEDGTTAQYVLPAWAPQSITIDRGTGTVTYDIQFEGTKEGNDTPVLKLTLTNSVIDEIYFGADEKTVDKAIAMDEADGISGVRGFSAADSVFDLSGRKVEKVQKSGIYIVNGKKVSVK